MAPPILAPAAVLILWSIIVLFWIMFTRFPAFKKAGIDLTQAEPGGRYQDVEPAMPAKVNWVSHNYVHLMEQPTLFYAVIMILAVAGDSTTTSLALAWAYCGLRIVHSLWQNLVNTIPIRFMLFLASSLCLLGLALKAVYLTLA
ncbi:MAPEG family protein [Pseudohalioglobus sediminis]|uniref:MAPEG family protein n=1 Tax=Pseudohalioglobus sediminis TaxID=2606449 RepID=A0A5B0X018_9GAMM|nr:MAPEG family protein [Pseudohalioglobus sediminis]KAA1191995.1 MAPEG family protein [Pseudohalioglobus sediminis]